MFLKALKKQNQSLIEIAKKLHQKGDILPDSYVIDVDTYTENATHILECAKKHGIKLYGMTKQIGRNPYLAKILIDLGYEGIVAVDYKEASVLHDAGVNVSHVGHLVQPPNSVLTKLVTEIQPEVITVYSIEKAKEISLIAQQYYCVQKILLKFIDDDDYLYPNQESGFLLSDIENVTHQIQSLPNIKIEGITHFPCFLFNKNTNTIEKTENYKTLIKAVNHLQLLGVKVNQVNCPSATSIKTIPSIAQSGGTHGEPGHALTGTMPFNTEGTEKEKVAMLYLSEVSHHYQGNSFCFAGGFYPRGHLENALVGTQEVKVKDSDPLAIDYHLQLEGKHKIGTPVVMSFRTQIFVTRSHVVLIKGLSNHQPRITGTYNSIGQEV
ncbi:YhfX family PLP-dependent enzyme [Vibrio sp. SS-MA-C1-2]|uniref:YhfX family PLP-dependent enzyme n=1 Tax=Vibrio sp. SS-MA-C1-2 TaxID=2908646 RepID=UPI001F27465D|nr:YhfX family PLP-dependent enzyme [Vibrio sp. SS-MA-C1-2]UJF17034.1 YhfX family PLP-dependent enzyme [Vibrio sp. SS-MA-C1-2]